jgi:hypothetical protein
VSDAGEVAVYCSADEGRWGDIGRLYQRRNDRCTATTGKCQIISFSKLSCSLGSC